MQCATREMQDDAENAGNTFRLNEGVWGIFNLRILPPRSSSWLGETNRRGQNESKMKPRMRILSNGKNRKGEKKRERRKQNHDFRG